MMPSSIPKSYCNRILATLPAADMLTSPAVHDVFPSPEDAQGRMCRAGQADSRSFRKATLKADSSSDQLSTASAGADFALMTRLVWALRTSAAATTTKTSRRWGTEYLFLFSVIPGRRGRRPA